MNLYSLWRNICDLLWYYSYKATSADVAVVNHLGSAPDASSFPHANRWYKHITSFSSTRQSTWVVGQVTLPATTTTTTAAAPKSPAKKEDKKKEEDVDDLFGDDDDDEEEPALDEFRQKAKDAAMARAANKEAAAKSQIVFDIKVIHK